MLLGIALFSLRQNEQGSKDRTTSAPFERDDIATADALRNVPAAPNTEDDPIAQALSADINDPSATESQRRAFASLRKRLASPTKESLLEDIKRDPASYHISNGADGAKSAHNPIHGIAATFDPAGWIEVRSTEGGNWSWRMESLDLAEAGPLSSDGAQVERLRGSAITEWYVNEDRGLEQFFTLENPIAADAAGESRIRLAMATDLFAEQADHDRIEFRNESGDPILHYHRLEVIDANVRPLSSPPATASMARNCGKATGPRPAR